MASVYLRRQTWWLCYMVNGKRHLESAQTKSRSVAEHKLAVRLAQLEAGTFSKQVKGAPMTFGGLVEKVERWVRANRPRSVGYFEQTFHFTRPLWSKLPVTQVTPQMVERFQADQQNRMSILGRKVSPTTVNHYRTVLHRTFALGIRWGYLSVNPVSKVDRLKEPPNQRRAFEAKELAIIFKKLEEPTPTPRHFPHALMADLMQVALGTGLRKSEQMSLRRKDIDLVHGMIHLAQTKSNRAHYVPMVAGVKAVMARYCKGKKPEDFLFLHRGEQIDAIRIPFNHLLKSVGLGDRALCWHCLRHTFATRAIRQGASIFAVSKMLNHSSINLTVSRYSHASPDYLRGELEKALGKD